MSILNKIFQKDKEGQQESKKTRKQVTLTGDHPKGEKQESRKTPKQNKFATGQATKPVSAGASQGGQEENEKARKNFIAYKILVRPMLTEKGTKLGKDNKYLFEVNNKSNKIEVKQAIKEVYGVMPSYVNIVNMKGKKVGAMKRISGRRKNWKKAIVTLRKGDYINTAGGK